MDFPTPMTDLRVFKKDGIEVVHAAFGRLLEDAHIRRERLLKEALNQVDEDLAKLIEFELEEGL